MSTLSNEHAHPPEHTTPTPEETTEDEPVRTKTSTYAFAIIIFFIVAITTYFILTLPATTPIPQPQTITTTYNNYLFTKQDQVWYTDLQLGTTVARAFFHYTPTEVENITVQGAIDPNFLPRKEMRIGINPEGINSQYTALAATELGGNLRFLFNKTPVAACTTPNKDCTERPIIDCTNDSTSNIVLLQANATGIIGSGNCLYLYGNKENLIKSADKLLYIFLGII